MCRLATTILKSAVWKNEFMGGETENKIRGNKIV